MSINKHVFQLTTEEFIELIREVVLSVVPPINNLTDIQTGKGDKEYYTREEAKNLLKISYATLWKYNKGGILPATKIGSRVYYKRKDIDDAMEGGVYA
ncbi:helix-turn-helix domain-containing protein [Flavobacteriaceae bacterium AU392]|nr:DNA-binding protein [Flavobacteriaceae bacterium]RKM86936.1 helix-turn-helix domain-containing protein [Flavobacteriaceae bacterium AU392]